MQLLMLDSPVTYRTRVDVWVGLVLALTVTVSLFALYHQLAAGTAGDRAGAVLTLVVLVGVGLVMIPTRYRIAGRDLVIQSGLLITRIPLEQIWRVYPSRSLLASPALSLDRLAVEYRAGKFHRPTIYISPVRRDEFLCQLAAAAGLVPQGDQLVRRSRR